MSRKKKSKDAEPGVPENEAVAAAPADPGASEGADTETPAEADAPETAEAADPAEAAAPAEASGPAGDELAGRRAAILVAGGFQDEEVTEPAEYLRSRGAEVVMVGPTEGPAEGKHGRARVEVTLRAAEASAEDFDLLVIPGGAAPEALRLDDDVLALTRRFFEAGKAVAAICRGPQVLISAGVLPGRTVTCLPGIRDDVRLAGARYRDRPVVSDRRLVTARGPEEIPAFLEATAALLAAEPAAAVEEDLPEEDAAEEVEA